MMDVAMAHLYSSLIVKIMCFNIYAAYSIWLDCVSWLERISFLHGFSEGWLHLKL